VLLSCLLFGMCCSNRALQLLVRCCLVFDNDFLALLLTGAWLQAEHQSYIMMRLCSRHSKAVLTIRKTTITRQSIYVVENVWISSPELSCFAWFEFLYCCSIGRG
jgi:hypothetical protein